MGEDKCLESKGRITPNRREENRIQEWKEVASNGSTGSTSGVRQECQNVH